MTGNVRVHSTDDDVEEIERRDTGLRIALTLLYVLIAGVLEAALVVLIVFELIWTLTTRRPPGRPVRDLANRIISYYYGIGRYLTYNESRVPFPFSDFPDPLEPVAWEAQDRESDSLGLGRWEESDEPGSEERL